MNTYDAVFFISVGTMMVGLISVLVKYCLKSKCEHFSICCGIVKIDRRVDLEVQEEMHAIDAGITDNDTIQPITQQPANQTKQTKPKRRPSNNDSDDLEQIALGNISNV